MERNIKVSIIMPTYNGSNFIDRAIESVKSQNFVDWELLVIDDGSIDQTGKIIEGYRAKDLRIVYLKNENNLGIQKTLNRGLKEARGEYIARIDDDDEWIDKDKIGKQVSFLDNNKDCGLVGISGIVVVDKNRRELYKYKLPIDDKKIKNRILSKNCFVHSSIMFRKAHVLELMGYDESITVKHIEDYDLWLKIGLKYNLYNLPGFGVAYMMRSNSISSKNKIEQFQKNILLIKKYKDKYPGYLSSLIQVYLKSLILNIFNIIPSSFKNKILKKYKEF